jgi:putative flippase GtrA
MLKKYFYYFYNAIAGKIRNLPIVQRHPSAKELIKYSIVGNFSNFLDLALYVYLTRAFGFWLEHYLWANALTIVAGSITRFILHKKWTFRHDAGSFHEQYLKFIAVLLVSLVLSVIILFLIVEYSDINDIVGKIISMALVTVFVYYLTKVWVFKKNNPFH